MHLTRTDADRTRARLRRSRQLRTVASRSNLCPARLFCSCACRCLCRRCTSSSAWWSARAACQPTCSACCLRARCSRCACIPFLVSFPSAAFPLRHASLSIPSAALRPAHLGLHAPAPLSAPGWLLINWLLRTSRPQDAQPLSTYRGFVSGACVICQALSGAPEPVPRDVAGPAGGKAAAAPVDDDDLYS